MTPGVEARRPAKERPAPRRTTYLPSERISLRKISISDIRFTSSPNRRSIICICTPCSPHGGGSALLASRSVEVDAEGDLVRVAEARAEGHLHAIVNVKTDVLADQRPLKLHLVLLLAAEAERDLRIRSAGQVSAREELHLRLEARDAGQQPLAPELGTRVEVAVAHVVRLKRDLSADLVRRLLVDKLLDEQPRVRARLNVEGALHQIVVHAKLDVVAVRLHLLAQLQHRVRRSLHVDREVQRPGPVSAQPIVSLRGGADQVVHG